MTEIQLFQMVNITLILMILKHKLIVIIMELIILKKLMVVLLLTITENSTSLRGSSNTNSNFTVNHFFDSTSYNSVGGSKYQQKIYLHRCL